MKSINSGGGPLILVPKGLCMAWRGHSDDPDCDDYIRACAVEPYMAPIEVGDGTALVLGQPPDETAVLRTPMGPALHRWICADSEEEMKKSVQERFLAAKEIEAFDFRATEEKYVLFDSAYAGSEFTESLELLLELGDYRVSTLLYEAPRTSYLLHVFKKC